MSYKEERSVKISARVTTDNGKVKHIYVGESPTPSKDIFYAIKRLMPERLEDIEETVNERIDGKGLESAEIIEPLDATIQYDIHKGEKRTRHYPGSSAYVEIWEIRIGDVVLPEDAIMEGEFERMDEEILEERSRRFV